MRARTAISLLLAAAHGSSCSPPPDRPSSVHDLRILAVRAEPAELQVGLDAQTQQPDLVELFGVLAQLRIRALVVDPNGAGRAVHFAFTACPKATDLRCEDADGLLALGEGTVVGEEAVWAFTPDQTQGLAALVQQTVEQDPFKGALGLWPVVNLRVTADGEEAVAAKRLVLSTRDPRFPELTPNQNPPEPRLTFNGVALEPGDVGAFSGGGEAELDVAPPGPGAKERYAVVDFQRDRLISLQETFRYAWFTTLGSFSPETTGGSDVVGAAEEPTGTSMSIPSGGDGEFAIYVVVRDGRGGETWTKRAGRAGAP